MDEEEELENTLIGQQQEEEAPAVNTGDVMMGGLGLGGAAFAAQTGRAPTPTPQGTLSPLAQRVAANDAARLAARPQPPALIGSTQVGTTTGFQPPAVTSTTGTPATTTTAGGQTGRGQPRLTGSTRPSADDFDFRINPARASRLARVGGPGALIYGAADLGLEALTGRSLSERIGEGVAGPLANLFIPGAQSQPAFTEAELQRARDNLSTGAQLDIMREDAEASVAPVTEVTPLQAALGALDEEIAGREANIVNNQVELAKQINELGTVSDDQRAVQDFMDERAERSGTTVTDVITPFQEQAELTADLFTDPDTEIGQFVPRATFTLPDGTIIQEDEGGNRREISAEQLRQFEQDMAGLGQPSVMGLGRGGDAGVIKSFDRPMGPEETQAALGGMTLNEYLNAPSGTPGASGLRTDPQGRMVTPVPQPAPQPAGQPAAQTGPAKVPDEIMSQVTRPAGQTAEFRDGNRDGIEDRQQGIFRPGELLGYDAQGNEVRAPGTESPVNRTPATAQAPASALSDFERASLAREARLAERDRLLGETQTERDTRLAQSRTQGSRLGGGLSQSDLRDLAQGTAKGATEGQKMRALEIQQRAGLGPFKPEQTELQRDFTQRRIDLLDKQLANAGIVPVEDPVLDPETGVFMQLYSDGVRRIKGNARAPEAGGFNLDGFVSGDEGDKSELPDSLKNSNPADFSGQTIQDKDGNKYTSDGRMWIKI